MAQAKSKLHRKIQKKAGVVARAKSGKANNKQSPSRALETWEDAISELKTMQFSNLDQAVYAVADNVLQRLGRSLSNEAEEREFLATLLRTDPGITDQLRKLLNIR